MADYPQFSFLIAVGFEYLKKFDFALVSSSQERSISNLSWKSQGIVNQAGNGSEEHQFRKILIFTVQYKTLK